MRNIRVFDLKEDKKINAKCLLVDISIGEYIELIKENLEGLDIQRGKILSRSRDVYKRLMKDLEEGTIIPPISLILKEDSNVCREIISKTDIKEIEKIINEKIEIKDLSILDGLQRTYCILNVIENITPEKKENFLNTRIRAELWYGMKYTGVLYKMLVLNTGQVKMSMKHQIEILNIPLREKIIKIASMDGKELKFSTSKEPLSIDDVYHYKFSDIVEAFTSFIVKDPIVDKTNVVVQELERMKFIEEYSSQEKLSKEEDVEEFVDVLIKLDESLWEKYKEPLTAEAQPLPLTSRKDIMGSAAVLSGIFAAFGEAFEDQNIYTQRKTKLFNILRSEAEKDPLKLEIMSKILEDEKKRTTKFGDTKRKFFFSAFREFLIKEEDDFETIWKRAVK